MISALAQFVCDQINASVDLFFLGLVACAVAGFALAFRAFSILFASPSVRIADGLPALLRHALVRGAGVRTQERAALCLLAVAFVCCLTAATGGVAGVAIAWDGCGGSTPLRLARRLYGYVAISAVVELALLVVFLWPTRR